MSISVLIMGESGTGKSSSIKNLDPLETFIINVLDKPLPFRGFKQHYIKVNKEGGNYYATDNAANILTTLDHINDKRNDIKTVIIDDFQYVMGNEFMRKARERGYDKFTEIGMNAWKIIEKCCRLREDITCFVLSHTEVDSTGRFKCKTIGKMLDDKITLEGMFSIVLHSLVNEGKYYFLTQHDGTHIAKSPLEMFDSTLIENDLLKIKNKINDYFTY